jgi:hypothetical protein
MGIMPLILNLRPAILCSMDIMLDEHNASDEIAILNIYAVEFFRRPGDLGFTAIVRASSGDNARREAWRLFPEYRRLSSATRVHALDYAEVDWDSGRVIVMKRQHRMPTPVFFAVDDPDDKTGENA